MIDLSKYRQLLDTDPELRARYDESVERHNADASQRRLGSALWAVVKSQIPGVTAKTAARDLMDRLGQAGSPILQQLSNPLQETEIP